MGELIQIRVTARIHDNAEAFNRWTGLARMAFGPQQDRDFDGQDLLTELVNALYDKKRLKQLPGTFSQKCANDIETAYSYRKKLHSLLADRNPQEADKLSYLLEDVLDRMEETADMEN